MVVEAVRTADAPFETSDFKVVYLKEVGSLRLSLIEVRFPFDAALFFKKGGWLDGISLTMVPLSPQYWQVFGLIGLDTIQHLHLPVSVPRQGEESPIITSVELDMIREHGEITSLGDRFGVDLLVSANNISYFLSHLWRSNSPYMNGSPLPPFYLPLTLDDVGVFPQKSSARHSKHTPTLRVKRLDEVYNTSTYEFSRS